MENIDTNYIEETIKSLFASIGIKDSVNYKKIVKLIRQGKFKQGVKEIADHLGLLIEIKLTFVSRTYNSSSTDNFESKHLVRTDWRGKSSEGIVAQVYIPKYIPMYGTTEFE
jgi:hypothetical protein